MPTIVHGFDWPDRLVVGTIGAPGARSFYLQARDGSRVVSVALEKQQSALLAEKVDEILDQLRETEGNRWSVPQATPVELVDNDPLDQPVEPEFRTGAMTLGWDPTTAQVVIEAYAFDDSQEEADPDWPDAEAPEPTEMMQIRIPVGTARAFATRTLEVVGQGRPICDVCGHPIDPEGHTHTFSDEV
ncbi:DUF3090 domain-containing protein [Frondihabitans australicus]|uniref:Putative repeat protein (TIGR03847 family) n=1 Tax=Frondihabitans australicus TaxID=386892 RepID=A0A495IKG1_9MICO|nr:DUF3090 domain-containing protein [Frondihabitans australicus]RKR76279.1 putative repeat protein (TIGR03847 family) [Frondihabitans australicus]